SCGDALAASGDWEDAALADLIRLYHDDSRLPRFLGDPALARATAGITRALQSLRTLEEDGAITPIRAAQLRKRLEQAQSFAIRGHEGHQQALAQVPHFLQQAQDLLHRHDAGWWG